jgi:hypothetical protein
MSAWYALLSFLALPIASFWFWPLDRESATELHALCLAGNRNGWIMMAMLVLLAVSYAGLAFGILRSVREPAANAIFKESPAQLATG